jgi:hypothetical protein
LRGAIVDAEKLMEEVRKLQEKHGDIKVPVDIKRGE